MAGTGQLPRYHGRDSPVSIDITSQNIKVDTESFARLTNLTPDPGTGRNPRMGGQNFTHCCLLAVNASLDIKDGYIVEEPSPFVKASVQDPLAATEANQFPCTAR